jgi:hypothetical protein
MDQLQQNIDSEKIDGQPDTGSLSSSTLPATEIKKRICALVFDSPARDSDDYIRAVVRQENNRWLFWLKNTTPYAVRMSIGNSKKADYFSEFTTLTLPLMIFGHENDCVLPEEAYRPMIEERLRLHPTWTSFYEAKGSGHLSSYDDDPDGYTEALLDFLQKWFPAAN